MVTTSDPVDYCTKNKECYTGFCRDGRCKVPTEGDPCKQDTCNMSTLICWQGICKPDPKGLKKSNSCKSKNDCDSSEYCNLKDNICVARRGLGGACDETFQCRDELVCNGLYCIKQCQVAGDGKDGGCFSSSICTKFASGQYGCVKMKDQSGEIVTVILKILTPSLAVMVIFIIILILRRRKKGDGKVKLKKDVEDPLPQPPPHIMTPIAEE